MYLPNPKVSLWFTAVPVRGVQYDDGKTATQSTQATINYPHHTVFLSIPTTISTRERENNFYLIYL